MLSTSTRSAGQLVTQAADAIVYADDQGLIRLWNAGAERIFGYSEPRRSGRV